MQLLQLTDAASSDVRRLVNADAALRGRGRLSPADIDKICRWCAAIMFADDGRDASATHVSMNLTAAWEPDLSNE
jgi:hypothetical protein